MSELNKWFLALEAEHQKLLTEDKWSLANAVWDQQHQRIAELEQQLAFATDAADKGDKARHLANGMQEKITELNANYENEKGVVDNYYMQNTELKHSVNALRDYLQLIFDAEQVWSIHEIPDLLNRTPAQHTAEHDTKVIEGFCDVLRKEFDWLFPEGCELHDSLNNREEFYVNTLRNQALSENKE